MINREILQNLPLFVGLDQKDVDEFIAQLDFVSIDVGQSIICEGQIPPHALFVLQRGAVDVIKQGIDGRGHIISSLTGPSLFGEIETFLRRSAIASISAVTDVELGVLDHSKFDTMCENTRPCAMKIVHNLAKVLSHRLAATDARMVAQFDLSVPETNEKVSQLRRVMYSAWQNENENNS